MEEGYKNSENNIFEKSNRDINVLGVISIIKVITIILIFFGVMNNVVYKINIFNIKFLYGTTQMYSLLVPVFLIIGYILWKYILIYMYKLKIQWNRNCCRCNLHSNCNGFNTGNQFL